MFLSCLGFWISVEVVLKCSNIVLIIPRVTWDVHWLYWRVRCSFQLMEARLTLFRLFWSSCMPAVNFMMWSLVPSSPTGGGSFGYEKHFEVVKWISLRSLFLGGLQTSLSPLEFDFAIHWTFGFYQMPGWQMVELTSCDGFGGFRYLQ